MIPKSQRRQKKALPRKADGDTVPLLRDTITLMPVSTKGTEKSMTSDLSSLMVNDPTAITAFLYTTCVTSAWSRSARTRTKKYFDVFLRFAEVEHHNDRGFMYEMSSIVWGHFQAFQIKNNNTAVVFVVLPVAALPDLFWQLRDPVSTHPIYGKHTFLLIFESCNHEERFRRSASFKMAAVFGSCLVSLADI